MTKYQEYPRWVFNDQAVTNPAKGQKLVQTPEQFEEALAAGWKKDLWDALGEPEPHPPFTGVYPGDIDAKTRAAAKKPYVEYPKMIYPCDGGQPVEARSADHEAILRGAKPYQDAPVQIADVAEDTTVDEQSPPTERGANDPFDPTDMTVAMIVTLASAMTDVDALAAVLEVEQAGAARKGAIKAIETQIATLKGEL